MNRLSLMFVALAVFAVGCGDYAPSAPSQENRTTFTLTALLAPANEVPPVTNADASGSGTATITLTVAKDNSGNITSATMTLQISVAGLPGGTTVTKAHIHAGTPGVNGGVFVDNTLASGELAIANGSGSITKNGINVSADQAAAILGNPAGHYFNVHTALNPDGAMRGQLAGSAAP